MTPAAFSRYGCPLNCRPVSGRLQSMRCVRSPPLCGGRSCTSLNGSRALATAGAGSIFTENTMEDDNEPTNLPVVRDGGGKFVKGQSGNKLGRPKKVKELRDAARRLTPAALKTVENILRNPKAHEASRLKAAEIVLAYGRGKPIATEVHAHGG